MSFSWFVYTSLTPKQALALEDRLRTAVDALIEAKPALAKKGGEWGDLTVGEAVPSADDVAELAEAYDREVSEEILDRLDACKSAIEVERHGTNELDPLQVSILYWLLDNLEPFLVDWGDFQIVASEGVKGDLADFPSAGDLANPGKAAPAAAKDDLPAEGTEEGDAPDLARSGEIAAALETVGEDPFLQKRFGRALEKYPPFIKDYVKLVVAQGAMSDAKAAKELGVTVDKLQKPLDKLHDALTELAEEADDDEE